MLKAAKSKKELTSQGQPMQCTADPSNETLQARRTWKDVVQKFNETSTAPGALYCDRLSLIFDGTIQSFMNRQFRQFIALRPVLQETLKERLERTGETSHVALSMPLTNGARGCLLQD